MLKIQLCFTRINDILRGDTTGKNTVFFMHLLSLRFRAFWFFIRWKENIQKTLLSVSILALYRSVSIDFNYNTYFELPFKKINKNDPTLSHKSPLQ